MKYYATSSGGNAGEVIKTPCSQFAKEHIENKVRFLTITVSHLLLFPITKTLPENRITETTLSVMIAS